VALLINYTVVWAPDEEEPTDTIYILETLWILRVLYANKEEGKLILFAEMKLEAWLEFKIINQTLYQSATFRPRGIWGKLYWYSVLPFHGFIFNGMLNKLIKE
jgi:hypothetical protein